MVAACKQVCAIMHQKNLRHPADKLCLEVSSIHSCGGWVHRLAEWGAAVTLVSALGVRGRACCRLVICGIVQVTPSGVALVAARTCAGWRDGKARRQAKAAALTHRGQ